jgi:hypothetical protein
MEFHIVITLVILYTNIWVVFQRRLRNFASTSATWKQILKSFPLQVKRKNGKISRICWGFSSSRVLAFDRQNSPLAHLHTTSHTKSILLVLHALTTDGESCSEDTYEHEVQEMVLLRHAWRAVLHHCASRKQCETRNYSAYANNDYLLSHQPTHRPT